MANNHVAIIIFENIFIGAFGLDELVKKFCFLADNVKQLPLTIEKALNQNNKNTALIEEYQKKMLYKLDGSASIRARDEILKRINR